MISIVYKTGLCLLGYSSYSMPAKVPQRCSQQSFPMELRPPTARKSHPNFFAHCKRNAKMKKYKKTIIPNVQNTMRTQVTPMVSNYGKTVTKRYISISKHHVNASFMYVWVNISRVQVRAELLFLPWEIPLLLWPATALSCFPLLALFRSFCHSILLFAQPSAFWNLRLQSPIAQN